MCLGRIHSNDILNPNYVIGLVDGEGSFTIYVRNPDKKTIVKRRVKVEPRFYIKLVERDKKILKKLKRFFKCGNVYFQRDKRRNHQNCYRYEVANRGDLENIIIPFFREYRLKLESKIKDFEIFCKIMKKIRKGKHLSKKGLRQIYQLKRRMH